VRNKSKVVNRPGVREKWRVALCVVDGNEAECNISSVRTDDLTGVVVVRPTDNVLEIPDVLEVPDVLELRRAVEDVV